MNDERIGRLLQALGDITKVAGEQETTKIVPNCEVIDSNPSGLTGYIIVKNELGYYIPAVKSPDITYQDGDLVNLLLIKGTEPIAFQHGSGSGTGGYPGTLPLTTKGDLLTRDTTDNIRLGVGSNGQVLSADSAQIPGIKWESLVTAKGDLISRSSTARSILPVGTNGQVLTVDSTQTLGIKWNTPSLGGFPFSVITVDPTDTDADYSTITDAIVAASAGDVIYVGPGTYPETLAIDKNVHLIGAHPSLTAITSATAAGTVTISSPATLVIMSNIQVINTSAAATVVGISLETGVFRSFNIFISCTGAATTCRCLAATGGTAELVTGVITASNPTNRVGVYVNGGNVVLDAVRLAILTPIDYVSGTCRGIYLNSANAAVAFHEITTSTAMTVSNGKLQLNAGTSINEFSTDGTMAGDSNDAVPTEQAVKEYTNDSLAAASVKKNATQSINNATATKITWQTELFDHGANFASSTFTAPVTGIYHVYASLRFSTIASGTDIGLHIRVNSSPVLENHIYPGASDDPVVAVSGTVSASAGQAIEVYGFQNSGVAKNVLNNDNTFFCISLHRRT